MGEQLDHLLFEKQGVLSRWIMFSDYCWFRTKKLWMEYYIYIERERENYMQELWQSICWKLSGSLSGMRGHRVEITRESGWLWSHWTKEGVSKLPNSSYGVFNTSHRTKHWETECLQTSFFLLRSNAQPWESATGIYKSTEPLHGEKRVDKNAMELPWRQ